MNQSISSGANNPSNLNPLVSERYVEASPSTIIRHQQAGMVPINVGSLQHQQQSTTGYNGLNIHSINNDVPILQPDVKRPRLSQSHSNNQAPKPNPIPTYETFKSYANNNQNVSEKQNIVTIFQNNNQHVSHNMPILQPDVSRPMPPVNVGANQTYQRETQLNSTLIENQKIFNIINQLQHELSTSKIQTQETKNAIDKMSDELQMIKATPIPILPGNEPVVEPVYPVTAVVDNRGKIVPTPAVSSQIVKGMQDEYERACTRNNILAEHIQDLMKQKEVLSRQLSDATQLLIRTPELAALKRKPLSQITNQNMVNLSDVSNTNMNYTIEPAQSSNAKVIIASQNSQTLIQNRAPVKAPVEYTNAVIPIQTTAASVVMPAPVPTAFVEDKQDIGAAVEDSKLKVISQIEDHIDMLEKELRVTQREHSKLAEENKRFREDLSVANEALLKYKTNMPPSKTLTNITQYITQAPPPQIDAHLVELNTRLEAAIIELENIVLPKLDKELQYKEQVINELERMRLVNDQNDTETKRKQLENTEFAHQLDIATNKLMIRDAQEGR